MTRGSRKDRRRQPRVPLESRTNVRIHVPTREAGPFFIAIAEGYLYDLNHLGAFVATDLPMKIGSVIDLEIELPGARQQKPVRAIVARCASPSPGLKPAGVGVRFVGNTIDEEERIRRLVTSTLALDLLNYGYESRRKRMATRHPFFFEPFQFERTPDQTIAFRLPIPT